MLLNLAEYLVYDCLGLDLQSRFAGALEFFIYDSLKIFLLLLGMIFAIGVFRTYLPERRLRAWMGKGGWWANFIASLFGAITPFCSCSSIPIFISLLKAGVPLGVTFSFLITSPIVNEYLVILMMGEFGIPVTLAYVLSGLAIGTLGGGLLGRMRLEGLIERDIVSEASSDVDERRHTWKSRLSFGWSEALAVIRQIWLWVLVGVAVGAYLHNYVPRETIHGMMEAAGIFSVPIATGLGVPMYGSCAAIVPVAVVLFEKGIPLGTALAFMMAMAALSLPEAIMLRRVMHLKLIAVYFAVAAAAIVVTGYLLNALEIFLVKTG